MTDETAASPTNGHEPEDAAFDETAAAETLAAENAELKDRLLRTVADMENLRRRAEREANDARAFAIQRFARDLLAVSDNLARALQHAPREAGVTDFITGVELTEKALLDAFERNGLKRVDPAAGDRFDPNLHQAMMEQPSDAVAAGAVVQTFQPGYELFGRIVRPAMVVVAAKGSGPKAEPNPYAAGAAGESGATVDRTA